MKQEQLAQQQLRVKRLLYLVAVGVVSVLAIFAVTLTFLVVISRGNKEASCALIETNRAEKRAQLQAYAESPPATETGRKLEQTYRDSLAAWDRLWGALGCKSKP